MTRADKLLEGFKLGSLGAGKPKFVDKPNAQEPESQQDKKRNRRKDIRIIHESSATKVFSNTYILWEDFDRLLYMFEVTAGQVGMRVSPLAASWFLRISCGVPNSPGSDVAEKESWSIASKMNTLRKHKNKYDKYLAIIKRDGIGGLLKANILKDIFRPAPEHERKYREWVEDKEIGEL